MGQERLVEDLREELARGEVLVVVGSGVSREATGDAPCARWDGLILDGIAHAAQTGLLDATKAEELRKRLEGGTVDERLDVAEEVSKHLGAPDGGEFRLWLRRSVGALRVTKAAVVNAVHALGAPLATTNYDDLLTRGRGITRVSWRDVEAAHEVLRGDRRDWVLHLHGCFDEPESVILGRQSYATLTGSDGAQAVQQGIAAMRSLLFVGCGDDGLSDPNLGHLLEWARATFGNSIYRHYRLCLEGERKDPEGRLFCVAYGEKYSDLAPFLLELAPRKTFFALPSAGHCFGRTREVEEVVTALLEDKPRPVPILGGPGMGKTTIALTALHVPRVAERFRERRCFVRCDGVKSRAELAAAIALPLGLPITPEVEAAVLAALAKGPAALVLDNMATPLDADRGPVTELLSILATIESLALGVTIRGHDRPRGVPWRSTTEPEPLAATPAAEAFVAAAGKPELIDDPDLPRLLEVLDGVPLAITLMGRFAQMYDTLGPVWSRWEKKRTAMLKEGEGRDRLDNIAVSYELSIGALSEPARRLLSVLALLPGGVAYGDLEGIFSDPDDAADELRRRALVFDEAQRVRMRVPLREQVVAVHRAEADDERRAVGHYLALAASEGRKVGAKGGAAAVAWLANEVANVEAMLGRSGAGYEGMIGAVYGWAELMRFSGLGSTAPIEHIAASAASAGRTRVAARSFKSLGDIALRRSDHAGAHERYEEALRLYRQVGDVLGEANCMQSLGDIALGRSDHASAREHYEEALPLYRQVGSLLGEANCVYSLGNIALERSDHASARERYEEALPLYRQVSDVLGEANCVRSLGNIAFRQSDHASARERYEEALPLYRRVGSVLGEANCIGSFGEIAAAEGNRQEAEGRYREALALYERIAEPYSIGWTHRRLARVVTDDAPRKGHVTAAREAWRSIGFDDLVAKLDQEFGE
ncbi:MAG: tetratricopeptide repeat protein [Thermoanaerobaculia bacterium]